jgi:hypothetical protein
VAKPTPMTPLSAVLQEACSKMRPALDPAQCQLVFNKKPVDLGCPVRLANIPSGSKLELVKGEAAAPAEPPRRCRPIAAAGAGSGRAGRRRAAGCPPALPPACRGPLSTAPAWTRLRRPLSSRGRAAASPRCAAAAPKPAPAPARPAAQPAPHPAAAAAAAAPVEQQAAAGPSSAAPAPADALGLGRPLQVFTHRALEEAGEAVAPATRWATGCISTCWPGAFTNCSSARSQQHALAAWQLLRCLLQPAAGQAGARRRQCAGRRASRPPDLSAPRPSRQGGRGAAG